MPRFPRRLISLTDEKLNRMARQPSHLAPPPSELQQLPEFLPPGPPAMPLEEQRLLQAVVRAPKDDAPRLAYAQWWDHHDPARAEFVRRQLNGEETSDFQLHFPRWTEPLKAWDARDIEFRRGFPESLSLAGRSFLSLGSWLFETIPLRELRLVAIAPYVEELAATPLVAKLEVLNLQGNWIGRAGILALLKSSHVQQLKQLHVVGNDADDLDFSDYPFVTLSPK